MQAIAYNESMAPMWKGQKEKGKAGEQGRGRNLRFLRRFAAIALGLGLLGLLLCFGLRIPSVLGPLTRPYIEEIAQVGQVELEIQSMGGVGWTGVRLHQVVIWRAGGRGEVYGELKALDIYPDLVASLKARRPKVKRVALRGGVVGFEQAQSEKQERPRSRESSGQSEIEDFFRVFAPGAQVEARDIQVVLPGIGEAIRVDELLAQLSIEGPGVEELEIQGALGEKAFLLALDEERLRADLSGLELKNVLAELPVEVELGAVAVSRQELMRLVQERSWRGGELTLEGLKVSAKGGRGLSLKVGDSRVISEGADLRWLAPKVEVLYPGQGVELRGLEVARRKDVEGLSFQGELISQTGGHIEVEGQWHRPTSLVSLNAWMHDFVWENSPAMAAGFPIQSGRISGAFHGDVDLIHGLVNLDGRFRIQELALELGILANQRLVFDEVEFALPLTADLRGRALSVAGGELSLGALARLGFHGHLIDAGGSYAFELTMHGEEIDAAQVATSLPAPLLGALVETDMEGRFGVSIATSGHTAEPESLVLEVSFTGDVQVGDELIWEGLEERFAGGEGEESRLFRSEYHPHRPLDQHGWTSLSDLPAHVPAAILSAEDVTFFQHEGLDWTGLRMAMVHNLKEGALVRGGSTISQQVAKNLFLTQDRTLSRKLQEAFLTWRVESVLSKERILELYLNVAEWGPDLYGLGAAAAYYFDKEAAQLTVLEAATLAAILPNPSRFGGALERGYMPNSREGKIERVLVNMRFLEQLEWPEYYAAVGELRGGKVGELEFERCGDDEEAPPELIKCSEIGAESGDQGSTESGSDDWELAGHRDPAGWIPLTH